MGIICDTSLLIAAEKKRFDLASFFQAHPHEEFWLAAITASELLHGVERAANPKRRTERKNFVEGVLKHLAVAPFQLDEARLHARLWAALESKGTMIGTHDLLVAATALSLGFSLATLNDAEFRRVPVSNSWKQGVLWSPKSHPTAAELRGKRPSVTAQVIVCSL